MRDSARSALQLAQALQNEAPHRWVPPAEGTIPTSEMIVYRAMVAGTRPYIERIVSQINGCYEQGWYDGCAVMMRRLIETLIIETFEAHSIASNIQKDGNFMFLRDMIGVTLAEPTWNLGRNTKKALKTLKELGDKSAHSRRYIAYRQDIDQVKTDFRVVIQELLLLSKLK